MNREHAEAVAVIEAQMGNYFEQATEPFATTTRSDACRMAASFGFRTNAITYLLGAVNWCESEKVELRDNVKSLSQWGAWSVRARMEALQTIVYNLDVPF